MTLELAKRAAALWPLEVQDISLAAHRENAVYLVQCEERNYALRLHRVGYRTADELKSELAFIAMLQQQGISVPQPLRSNAGHELEIVEGVNVSVLSWMPGRALGSTGQPLDIPDRVLVFRRIGALIAKMHNAADQWAVPRGFARKAWDFEGLLGDNPQWGRFWENPMLSTQQVNLLLDVRAKLHRTFESGRFDQGLIHADMVSENILLDGNEVSAIDFDDFGPGYRLQDIATALVKHQKESDYADLRRSLIAGYESLRPLDEGSIDLFLLIRHLSYVGWISTRMSDEYTRGRSRGFIADVVPLAERFLAG